MNPWPAGRREVGRKLCHLGGPHADEVEIAGEREPARRISGVRDRNGHGDDRELFGVIAVAWRTGVEILVPLTGDLRTAGMQNAVEGLIGQRLSCPEVVQNPKIRRVIVVEQPLMVDLEVRRSGCARRNRLGIAGMQTVAGVMLEDIDRVGGARQAGKNISGRFGQPELLPHDRSPPRDWARRILLAVAAFGRSRVSGRSAASRG